MSKRAEVILYVIMLLNILQTSWICVIMIKISNILIVLENLVAGTRS